MKVYKSLFTKQNFKEASFGQEASKRIFLIFRNLLQKRLHQRVYCSNMLMDMNLIDGQKTLGLYYHIGLRGRKIRINFYSTGSSYQIHSIDFWLNPSKLTPTLNALIPEGVNLVQMLNQIVEIYNNQQVGEIDVFFESATTQVVNQIESFLTSENISDNQLKMIPGADLYNKFISWSPVEVNVRDFSDSLNSILKRKGLPIKRVVAKKIIVTPAKKQTRILTVAEKQLQNEIENYKVDEQNLKDSIELLKSLVRGIGVVTNGILVTGTPGVGKTYTTQEILHKERGLTENVDYRFLSGGSMSAIGLFQELHNHRDELIVIDDNDSIFSDQDAVNMLKGALQTQGTRWVTYNKSSITGKMDKKGNPVYESPFEFTGQIIMITNLVGKSLSLATPVLDRVNQVHFDISEEDLISYVEEMLSHIYSHIDLDIKKNVFEFFKVAGSHYKSAKTKGISIRAYTKTLDLVIAGLPEADWKRLAINTI